MALPVLVGAQAGARGETAPRRHRERAHAPCAATLGSEWLTDHFSAPSMRKNLPGAWFRQHEFAEAATRRI
jgi:hypothetical protein